VNALTVTIACHTDIRPWVPGTNVARWVPSWRMTTPPRVNA